MSMRTALFQAIDKSNSTMDDEERKECVAVMERRLRLACRHLQQALVRSPPPKWVSRFMSDGVCGEREEEEQEEEEEDKEAPEHSPTDSDHYGGEKGDDCECDVDTEDKVLKRPAAHIKYYYGFDQEHEQVYRAPVGTTQFDIAQEIVVPPDATDDDPIWGVWPDASHPIEDISVGEWKSKKSATESRSTHRRALWQGTHKVSNHDVWVSRRQDHVKLISVWEKRAGSKKQKQICSVVSGSCASEEEAIDLMIRVANAYVQDDVKSDGMYPLRDSFMPGLRKRKVADHPAGGKASSSSTKGWQAIAAPPLSLDEELDAFDW